MNALADLKFVSIPDTPPKYTQFSEGDPYFFDFQANKENREMYVTLRAYYINKYPEFWRMLEILEIVLQTYRSEYDRLSNLSIGYLRSTEMNNFERWQETSQQKWNRLVLTHKQVPQEFYTSLLGTANKIRNEYFEQPLLTDPILSNHHTHDSLYEILKRYPRIDVTNKQLREHLLPIGIQELIKKNPWEKKRWYFTVNGKDISPQECAKNMLNQVLFTLSVEDENLTPQEDASMIRINPKIFFDGFEEAVDLTMLLANKEYSEVLSVLQNTKNRIWRLQDEDFETFKPYYLHLAKIFFLHHTYSVTRPGLHRKSYQNLAQLFQTTMGLTQAKVKQEVADLTSSEIHEVKEYAKKPFIDKLLKSQY